MSLTELIYNRRSCRRFLDTSLSEEQVMELKRAALASPTSKNCKSWHFAFVRDREVIKKLAESKEHGASLVAGCSLAVVVFGNPTKTDVWVEDASIASSFLLLQAQALGLGACWVQLRERTTAEGVSSQVVVRELLGTASELVPVSIIAIGYPDETHRPYSDERLPWDHLQEF